MFRQSDATGETPRVVGDATSEGCEGSRRPDDSGWQVNRPAEPNRSSADRGMESEQWTTEPALGGNADGPAGGLGHAELFTACDNRTDELRLLGNGVVPATAEIAFKTLLAEVLQ